MDVFPDFGGVGGAGDLQTVIGALLTFVLIIAVLMLIVCAGDVGDCDREWPPRCRSESPHRRLDRARCRDPRRWRSHLDELAHQPRLHPLSTVRCW